MNRIRRILLSMALALVSLSGTACEDPIIIVGDLPGIMRRIAGIPNSLGASVDTIAREMQLNTPRGLAVDDDGTLYIADSGNGRIVAVRATGHATVVAGNACGTADCLVTPYAVALAPDGSLWIADPGANRIFRLDLDSQLLEVRAGTGVAGDSPDGTPALEATLNGPAGIAVSASGVVYFSERDGHKVRWIQTLGGLRTLAGTGEAGYSDGSPATLARLNSPTGLVIAGSLLYVADEVNNRVREINITGGGIRTVAGNGVAAYSETDSIATTAKLNRPRAVAVTADRTQLFIADAVNDRVRVVNLVQNRIGTFAGNGDPIFNDEGLDAPDTSLDGPAGLAVHPDGILFIADTGHQIVWRTPLRF